jgi:purine-nucleoside phosphorylase
MTLPLVGAADAPRTTLAAVTDPTPPPDPYSEAERAARRLAALTGVARHDVALVMGSGWAAAADALGREGFLERPVTDLPGFAAPVVAGHGATLRSLRLGDRQVLLLLGRTHLYEGRGPAAVVHGVRTAVAAGARVVVLTNGAGGLRPTYRPGQPVLISDHLNLTATSPLAGPRFVDLTDLYSARLRTLCREVDPTLEEGVYAQLPGPHYETPAEVRMVMGLGADLVGMSTALEAIAAREGGAEVLGLSLVTNLAAGLTAEPLDHAEVLAAGRAAAAGLGRLLVRVLERL